MATYATLDIHQRALELRHETGRSWDLCLDQAYREWADRMIEQGKDPAKIERLEIVRRVDV